MSRHRQPPRSPHPGKPSPGSPPPTGSRRTRPLSNIRKALLGGAVTLTAFLLLELLLWACRVQPAWRTEDPYAGFSRHIPHFIREPGPDGAARISVAPAKSAVLNPQTFAARKPTGTYRIICLGGSTTYGRPFYDATSFPGWLRAFLPAADPSRSWEVINAGAISYASYRVLGVMEELARHEPDLFILYTGQNEFLERRTYDGLAAATSPLADAASLVNRTRLATVMRQALDAAGVARKSSGHRAPVLGENTRAIPIDAVGPAAYHRDDALAADVLEHYRASLRRMVALARSVGAEILFVVPASNLADFAPFKSEHRPGLSATELTEWYALERAGRAAAAAGRFDDAVRAFESAIRLDDRHAGLWFHLGNALRALGRHGDARTAFRRAIDEDICPLRMPSPFTLAVREIIAETGACGVDFEDWVARESPDGLADRRFFHDHVHPTLEGNRGLALALLDCLAQRGIVRPSPDWNDATLARVTASVEASIDRPLHALQLRMLAAMLGWLGQPDQARHQAELALALAGPSPDVLLDQAQRFQSVRAHTLATEFLERAAAAHPEAAPVRFQLALALLASGRDADALNDLQDVVRLDPNHAEAHTRLGAILAAQERYGDAERHFAEVVRLAPHSDVALNNLGLAMARQGRFEDAIVAYRQALAANPRSVAAHVHYGLALEGLGQTRDAIEHFRTALRLDPSHSEAATRLKTLLAVPAP
ncbi:MAG: tetratricopeptide repeat protein [Verrucomicrobiae bacterium]|nr:tetratricopeptide repeat protein [Verrucomicrobiae bacterium]